MSSLRFTYIYFYYNIKFMKKLKTLSFCLLALLSLSFFSANAQIYDDPNIPKPSSGYGAEGTHAIDSASFPNPNYAGQRVQVFYPTDVTGTVPTIFYNHAYGGYNSQNILGLLRFAARKGYAIVFVPYQTTGVTVEQRYDNLLTGFKMAARKYTNIIDTTRVGFLGYSFGGGAAFANSLHCFRKYNWGSNGRFIYAMAQWYSYRLSNEQLTDSFPSNTKVLVQVLDDDATNDHRMAIDIFSRINVPNSEKDFIKMRSDTINGYIYSTAHSMPNSATFDALDYYGYYRLLAALCDYTFTGSLVGKNVALGNGSLAQVTMPNGLKPLLQTDSPTVIYPESKYLFPCSSSENVRQAYCPSAVTAVAHVAQNATVTIYPNPVTNVLYIDLSEQTKAHSLQIFNSLGQKIWEENVMNQQNLRLDTSLWPSGMYWVNTGTFSQQIVK